LDIGSFDRLAAVLGLNIEDGHVGQGGETIAGAACDFDRRTVHVHLAVANSIEPCPSQSVFARGNIGWNFERGGGGAAIQTGAATLDGVDDFELRIGSWSQTRDERDLARSTTVDGGAFEGHGLLGTGRHLRYFIHSKVHLAGVV